MNAAPQSLAVAALVLRHRRGGSGLADHRRSFPGCRRRRGDVRGAELLRLLRHRRPRPDAGHGERRRQYRPFDPANVTLAAYLSTGQMVGADSGLVLGILLGLAAAPPSAPRNALLILAFRIPPMVATLASGLVLEFLHLRLFPDLGRQALAPAGQFHHRSPVRRALCHAGCDRRLGGPDRLPEAIAVRALAVRLRAERDGGMAVRHRCPPDAGRGLCALRRLHVARRRPVRRVHRRALAQHGQRVPAELDRGGGDRRHQCRRRPGERARHLERLAVPVPAAVDAECSSGRPGPAQCRSPAC